MQALSIKTYLETIKQALQVVLNLRDFPSEMVEKQIKPEIEIYEHTKKGRQLVLNPIFIARSEKEKCLIQPSINSVRVSIY